MDTSTLILSHEKKGISDIIQDILPYCIDIICTISADSQHNYMSILKVNEHIPKQDEQVLSSS